MARNIKIRQSPAWPVTSCAAAHTSGDFVIEDGLFGVAVETNLINAANTLIKSGVVTIPCGTILTIVEGTPIYFVGTTLTAGTAIVAAPQGQTVVAAPNLTTTAASNTQIGRARGATYLMGLTTVVDMEISRQS